MTRLAHKQGVTFPSEKAGLFSGIIKRAYPSAFLLALTFNINGMVDSMLAGVFFTPLHIAAVGVVMPIHLLFAALLDIAVKGTYTGYTLALGRAQRRKGNEIFSAGLLYLAAFGVLFAVLSVLSAKPLVMLFGATAPRLCRIAVRYLCFTAPAYPLAALTRMLMLILNVYGHQRDTFIAGGVNLFGNVICSLLTVLAFPTLGIAALGVGTWVGHGLSLVVCRFLILYRRIPLEIRFRRTAFRPKRVKELLTDGIGDSADGILDGVMAGVINRLIAASVLGITGLSCYAIVLCFWRLAGCAAEGMTFASQPLFGICYAEQDKGALKTAVGVTLKRGALYTAAWVLMIFAFSPLLMKIYLNGATGTEPTTVWIGILVTLAFAPVFSLKQILTAYFSVTEHPVTAAWYAIFPDSVLLPLLLVALLPVCGYYAVWLSLGGNALLFFGIVLGIAACRERRLHISGERFLQLHRGRCVRDAIIDASLHGNDQINTLAEQIQTFLKTEQTTSKVAYFAALCVEELVCDITKNAKSVKKYADPASAEVRIISSGDTLRILIANVAAPYNPLDFEYDPEDFAKIGLFAVQKIARKIDYNYVYHTNIITIQMEKELCTND